MDNLALEKPCYLEQLQAKLALLSFTALAALSTKCLLVWALKELGSSSRKLESTSRA